MIGSLRFSVGQRQIFWIGWFVVAATAMLAYAPALKMQFRPVDDYTLVAWAARLPLPEYLAQSLDPRVQGNFYRPVLRFLLLSEYVLFGANASYYHLIQTLLHAANAALLIAAILRATTRWRIAVLTGLVFAAFPTASETVFWISDAAPLATFFMLTSLWFWISHLQSQRGVAYWLAIGAMFLAFLSKEVSIVLPVALFLLDRLVIRRDATWAVLARRYAIIGALSAAYVALEIAIQSQGIYLNEASYAIGNHVLSNYLNYFGMLAFPWGYSDPFNSIAVWVVGGLVVVVTIFRRSGVLFFLLLIAFLTVGPVVLSPQGAFPRYLYLAVIPWTIAWALAFTRAGWVLRSRVYQIAASVAVVALLLANSFSIADAAANFAEQSIRRVRVPYRDIMNEHPTVAPDTLLFLIDPPYIPITDAAGMFYLRYGTDVTVRGTYEDGSIYVGGRLPSQRANLRDHSNTLVYYFDETLKAKPVRVDKIAETRASPELPRDFQIPIRLEGYEITSATLRRNEPLALILYWRATGKIEMDYTVFVHLVNPNGDIIAGEDSAPRGGRERTSKWRLDQFTGDGHVLIVPPNAPAGTNYRLEVGLYDQSTLERVSIVNANGAALADQFVIEPLQVAE